MEAERKYYSMATLMELSGMSRKQLGRRLAALPGCKDEGGKKTYLTIEQLHQVTLRVKKAYSVRINPNKRTTVKQNACTVIPTVIQELEAELEAMRRLYDRFGEAHIRRMVKEGISPKL